MDALGGKNYPRRWFSSLDVIIDSLLYFGRRGHTDSTECGYFNLYKRFEDMKRPFNPDKEILNYCEHIMNAHILDVRIWQ